MELSNISIAKKLREVATAYQIKKALPTGRQVNLFQIRAYETAADAVEHLTSEVQDLWEAGQLNQVPGLGESLQAHLNELFKTGKVKHWEEVKRGISEQVFLFIDIPGVGPKTALQLANLGVKSLGDLQTKIKSGELVKKGFSAKIAEKIMDGVRELESLKSGRMLLPYAYTQAEKILDYLKKCPGIEKADVLGSLRRMVATVGDLDFAVASKNPKEVVDYITKMPGIVEINGQGEAKITLFLSSGLHVDFLITDPDSYGALLQHFTGSKQHNIHLRTIAEDMGYSLSEYGIKNIKTGKVHPVKTEEELYSLLKMETPSPEIREDNGEIEAALEHKLPKLVEIREMRGDLHIHSNFPLEPSHGPGANSVEELVRGAVRLGYEYIGIADHPPSFTNHTKDQIVSLIRKRNEYIEHINKTSKNCRVLKLLEVDILPDGALSVPDEGLKLLDFAVAGVHSAHRQDKDQMTNRILKALENLYVKVLSHPTGRIINERSSYDADWEVIFKYAAKYKKAIEINAFPNRLDLSDNLVKLAKSFGVKFVINTDSHSVEHMDNMKFGVAVARCGWVTQEDVINSWQWTRFAEWFKIS